MMELKLKLLLLLPFFLLVVYPSSGERRGRPRQRRISIRTTPRPALNTSTSRFIWVPSTPRPTPSVSSIPKEKCGLVLDELPRYFQKFNKLFPLCLRLNESQLLQMLKDVGGFNPRYVAINKEDACKFTDISQDTKPLPRNSSGPAIPGRQKRMVSRRSRSTLRRGCWSRGSFADGTSLKHQCTECAATTQLPADVFPPFINEAICGDADGFCYRRIGRCIQKVIRFTFLRRTGEFERNDDLSNAIGVDVYVEEIDTLEQDIRSCCECRLFSFFR